MTITGSSPSVLTGVNPDGLSKLPDWWWRTARNSTLDSPMSNVRPEYDGMSGTEYDPQFTADISTRMRVPDKIGPVSSGHKTDDMFADIHRSASMNVPDKIIVVGQDQSRGVRPDPNLHLDDATFTTEMDIPLSLNTPPRILKLNEISFPEHTEKPRVYHHSGDNYTMDEDKLTQNGYIQTTPQRHPDSSLHRQALLATPGEHLLINDEEEDDFTVLRKQVAKLSYHVIKLEEDNASRRQREFVLYPLMFGYLFVQMMKWFLRTK